MSRQTQNGAHIIAMNDYPSQPHGKHGTSVKERDWAVWSWLNFIFNPIAFWCSISALIFSYLTEVYNKTGDPLAARRKSRCALSCNIGALILFIFYVAAIVVLFVAFPTYVAQWRSNQYQGTIG